MPIVFSSASAVFLIIDAAKKRVLLFDFFSPVIPATGRVKSNRG